MDMESDMGDSDMVMLEILMPKIIHHPPLHGL
jgi:hypothetical protein